MDSQKIKDELKKIETQRLPGKAQNMSWETKKAGMLWH